MDTSRIATVNCVTTYPTGSQVDPMNVDPSQVHLQDVAHHLSMLCRFSGGARTFYSVAEHSVLVSRILRHRKASTAEQMLGLLHDAPEYVLQDINTPLKERLLVDGVHFGRPGCMVSYRVAEDAALRRILIALAPTLSGMTLSAAVKQADQDAFMIERALLQGRTEAWHEFGALPTPGLLHMVPFARPPHAAASLFLAEFRGLLAALQTLGPASVSSPGLDGVEVPAVSAPPAAAVGAEASPALPPEQGAPITPRSRKSAK